jgi:hypothetical protein
MQDQALRQHDGMIVLPDASTSTRSYAMSANVQLLWFTM